MATTFQYKTLGIQTLMTTELNTLANGNAATASSAYNNTDKDFWADFELVADAAGNFTANATVSLYLLTAIDGSNYEGVTANAYAGSFVCLAEHPGRYTIKRVPLPPCNFKAYLVNNSGQNFAASANTLKMFPYSQQGT